MFPCPKPQHFAVFLSVLRRKAGIRGVDKVLYKAQHVAIGIHVDTFMKCRCDGLHENMKQNWRTCLSALPTTDRDDDEPFEQSLPQ